MLETLAEASRINTLFLATFTYGRGIGGRQPRGNALPDHGKQEYDDNYHGGNFATPHPQYYRNTSIAPAEGARSSRLRCHRRRAAARAQARHEGDLLVRRRVPEGCARARPGVRSRRPRPAASPRLLPQSQHAELLARAHRGLPALVRCRRADVRQRAAGAAEQRARRKPRRRTQPGDGRLLLPALPRRREEGRHQRRAREAGIPRARTLD